jgi:hypothetical protein
VVIIAILVIGLLGWSVLSSTETSSQKRDIKPQIRVVNTEIIDFQYFNFEIFGI